MTKFADPKFSVAAPLTEAYAEGYARTFGARPPKCETCYGTGTRELDHRLVECEYCRSEEPI